MYKWTDDLLCGIDEIDEQHRQLFVSIDNISICIDNGKDMDALKEAFVFLEEYVIRHFAMEEHYMQFYNYSGYTEHKAEHKQFCEDFTELRSKYISGQQHPYLTSELEGSLYHWLARHLDGFDKQMCIFLKEKLPIK